MNHKAFARKGGLSVKKKYGTGYYKAIGRKGASALRKKYGEGYFSRLSKLGIAARLKNNKKRLGRRNVINKDLTK